MQYTPDFADDYFCLPPLDILVAVEADESIHRLADQLMAECHHVALVGHLQDPFAEVDARAPEVVLVDATQAEGVALARRVRAEFGERIVLVGLGEVDAPTAFARLFDYLLPKPVEFGAFARALGLIPEPQAVEAVAAAGVSSFRPEGWRQAA